MHWLTPEGLQFPTAVGNYIHKVATRLHSYPNGLPDSFLRPLIEFVSETKSHVATLNYDKLLYDPFLESGLMAGYYETTLVDGMLASGFSAEALQRR